MKSIGKPDILLLLVIVGTVISKMEQLIFDQTF
jgi:hypothetical protein